MGAAAVSLVDFLFRTSNAPKSSATETEAEAPYNNFDINLVLDFGSQMSHLILRRLRALKVYAKILPCTTKLADLPFKPKGIVLSGGPSSVYDQGAPHVNPAVFKLSKEIVRIRHLVGDHAQVIGAVSGGVDSTVAAKLMKEAIGDRFHAILVDNGVMRLNACQQGVTEPEKKRKIIGGTFIDLFEKEAIRIEKDAENTPNAGKVEWFLQGTLYPDVIESLSSKGPSATIKTYHNVGGLPDTLKLKLIEPLRELFKDEVRSFDREFGIHSDLIMRHPFPGPGIAIRILGEVTPERVAIARAADNIFISMIKEAGIYDQMPQSYAGRRQGDARVYGYIVILRAVQTADFMSCEPFEFDFNLLKISTRIVNEVEGVSRVVYDITSKPPGTIELE
ncbi:GMP synthase [glutamine-hydrolyzing] [Colletotrichum tanaceti]|uniref:GMP synthase (glutamine-hydrolyzing) n=1 Tax=Colletotrichum tanaceti TaxID=1306861 RepID=A0A4U6XIE9_9PEZI|nr:GMP synthase [glutamine-hydrolyzing] [Colletotrichum tanaceti]